ncbi:MAG: veratrol--corrinoid protein metyltransferase [Clostridia bacterium]|nr:veratrol--corrinoid protein metyltransferase [Clostridia bacterium]
MTEKENYLRVVTGEMPEWLPLDCASTYPTHLFPRAVCGVMPEPYFSGHNGGKDIFGVEYTNTDSTGGMSLPTPNKFILKDIHDWRKVIKVPDINDYDFKEMARKQLANIDRTQSAVLLNSHLGYFQLLMSFMGFSEGLFTMACYPEEVYDLFEYMADFFDECALRTIDAYRPDIFGICDDVASAQSTFMSHDMYVALIKPFQMRLTEQARKLGLPIDMHCCGKCESLIDDWLDLGVTCWNPPQDMNDLVGIKKKYGRRIAMSGCSSSKDPANFSWSTEEEVRAEVRRCIDTYAPGGGFIFRGNILGEVGDPTLPQRREWVVDEFLKYGRSYYQTHA